MRRTPRSTTKDNLWDEIADIKREKILQGAVDLFYEKGYLPSTVDAVAERLGATKPFIYYHFQSKVELLSEICTRGTSEALALTEKIAARPLDPVAKLAMVVREFTTVVLKMHKHVSIYFREQLNLPPKVADDIARMRRKIDGHFRSILTEGKARGDFVFGDLAIASQVVTGMVSYAFAWYRETARLSKEQICDQMVEHVLRTVGVTEFPQEFAVRA